MTSYQLATSKLFLFFAFLWSSKLCATELSLPHFFSDHMVLQRDVAAKVWGRAAPGSEVTAQFKGKTANGQTDAQGKWSLALETGPADAQGADLIIQSGSKQVQIHDVLVGEVWLASGQSNMYFTMGRISKYKALIAETNLPGLRMFTSPLTTGAEPADDVDSKWLKSEPSTVPDFSAVAFFFARKLHQELNVPVGVISTAWGGKPVETFTSTEALNQLPQTKALVDEMLAAEVSYNQEEAEKLYQVSLEKWKQEELEFKKKPATTRGKLAKKPNSPKRPIMTEGKPGVLFNSLINPYIPYSLKGFIWYQGEANSRVKAVPYDLTLPLMIGDWRKRWGQELPFYFVQLANFHAPSTKPGVPDSWALTQDRMRKVLSTTAMTGMAVINDVGEAKDIHPQNKKDPGERLASWALAKDYGKQILYSSPLYDSFAKEGQKLRIKFTHAGEGLKARDGQPLQRFEIAGADRVWHWAEAEIQGKDEVLLSSAAVPEPVAARYAWAANPEGANLVNSEGLPASIFRTDDWDDVVSQKELAEVELGDAKKALYLKFKDLKKQREAAAKGSKEYQILSKKMAELLSEQKALQKNSKQ